MDEIKDKFTIKDLENISGVKAHTIRIWEKRYNLLQPKRTETNIRYYTSKSLQKLLNVALLNKHNFKISKIAEMSEDILLSIARELSISTAIDDSAINSFKLSMFQFDKVLFNTTYQKLLESRTFNQLFKEVFIPFLEQIGVMWQTETLLPVHEHFISNLIVQKIQIQTEKIVSTKITNNETYVLFLPEGEIHEIGLLYLNYILMQKGYNTVYLGRSLPLDNLNFFIRKTIPHIFITQIIFKPYVENISSYFQEVNSVFENSPHRFVAIGKNTAIIKDQKFSIDIECFPSVKEYVSKF